jgi:hypothetical protein
VFAFAAAMSSSLQLLQLIQLIQLIQLLQLIQLILLLFFLRHWLHVWSWDGEGGLQQQYLRPLDLVAGLDPPPPSRQEAAEGCSSDQASVLLYCSAVPMAAHTYGVSTPAVCRG